MTSKYNILCQTFAGHFQCIEPCRTKCPALFETPAGHQQKSAGHVRHVRHISRGLVYSCRKARISDPRQACPSKNGLHRIHIIIGLAGEWPVFPLFGIIMNKLPVACRTDRAIQDSFPFDLVQHDRPTHL